MKDYKLNFSMEMFWKAGAISFAVIALMGLIGLVSHWNDLAWYGKVSSIASTSFQCVVSYMFYWMLKGSKTNQVVEKKTDAEMLKVLEEANK